MKNFKLISRMLGLSALLMLNACGGDDDLYNNQYYNSLAQACGTNMPMNSAYTQTVRGQEAGGGLLDLMIYGDGSGAVGAIGELYIPSLDAIGIFSNQLGSQYFDPNYYNGGYIDNYYGNTNGQYGNNYYNGNVGGQLRTCVSSNGISGYMETDGVADRISIQLQGSNVSLVPDNTSYAQPTIQNQYIDGDWILSVGGQGSARLSF